MDIIEQKGAGYQRHPWELARFEVLLGLINTHLPQTSEARIIADIGCGDCYFAQQLLKARPDAEVFGLDIEYSTEGIIQKQQEIGEPRFHLYNNLDELSLALKERNTDLILLFDVIEHIEKDSIFLRQLTASIHSLPDAKMLITVPAFQSLFSGHDVFLKHYRRYTHRSLRRAVADAGLAPLRSGYFFFSLLPLRFFHKMMEKAGLKRKQTGAGNWQGNNSVSTLIKNYLLFDFKFSNLLGKTGINLPGLSVYCICKKPAL